MTRFEVKQTGNLNLTSYPELAKTPMAVTGLAHEDINSERQKRGHCEERSDTAIFRLFRCDRDEEKVKIMFPFVSLSPERLLILSLG